MRICKKCEIEKDITEYPLKRNGKIKSSYCKVCYNDVYYLSRKEIINEKRRKDYNNKSIQIINNVKLHYSLNKEIINKIRKEKYILDKDFINEKRREDYKLDKEKRDKIKELSRKYYNENKDKINDKRKDDKRSLEYYYNNKEKMNNRSYQRVKERRKNDPLFKLTHNIRSLIRLSIVNQFTTKSKKTIEILGCSFDEFKSYLESKFDDKMNWENQGTYWHMDHIIPISSAQTEEDVYRLNHYTNFQPLYWLDNLKKSNKIENGN
jgi:hypothetical protein